MSYSVITENSESIQHLLVNFESQRCVLQHNHETPKTPAQLFMKELTLPLAIVSSSTANLQCQSLKGVRNVNLFSTCSSPSTSIYFNFSVTFITGPPSVTDFPRI